MIRSVNVAGDDYHAKRHAPRRLPRHIANYSEGLIGDCSVCTTDAYTHADRGHMDLQQR